MGWMPRLFFVKMVDAETLQLKIVHNEQEG